MKTNYTYLLRTSGVQEADMKIGWLKRFTEVTRIGLVEKLESPGKRSGQIISFTPNTDGTQIQNPDPITAEHHAPNKLLEERMGGWGIMFEAYDLGKEYQ